MLKTLQYKADFCVVGGGLAGMCAAIAAARHGAKVVLMQERPVRKITVHDLMERTRMTRQSF